MRVFKDIDIIRGLQKIVENNNLHYQTDFKYDIDTLKTAANGSHFLWMSRSGGTYLFDERDVYIRNTAAHNTWRYYTDSMYYGVKAFAVAVRYSDSDRPFGDVYELNYNAHIEEVRKNSFNAKTVDITFKPTRWEGQVSRTFEIAEYNDNWNTIINRYGSAQDIRHNLNAEDDAQLTERLTAVRQTRETEAIPADIAAYVREMVKDRFHGYGYTRDDMAFTTPHDAYDALKYLIPVYILHPDNTAEKAATKVAINNAIFDGRMFGMGYRDKKLLNFYKTGNTLDDLPFSQEELHTIFFMALDRGKETITDEKQRTAIDNIIQVLDTALFSNGGHDDFDCEHDYGLDNGIGQ